MNIKELIIRSHEAMKIECSKCEGSGYFSTTKQDSTIYDCLEICNQCEGTGTKPISISKKLMDIIMNLCKALECWENRKYTNIDVSKRMLKLCLSDHKLKTKIFEENILNRFEDHLASVFIGLFDLCGTEEVRINEVDSKFYSLYKDCSVYMHIRYLIELLLSTKYSRFYDYLIKLCNHHNINIDQHIQAKLEYLEGK